MQLLGTRPWSLQTPPCHSALTHGARRRHARSRVRLRSVQEAGPGALQASLISFPLSISQSHGFSPCPPTPPPLAHINGSYLVLPTTCPPRGLLTTQAGRVMLASHLAVPVTSQILPGLA